MAKTKVWTREEVLAGVKEALVEALGVDDDEIKEVATLTMDLGAESIDFLDITYRLEKKFNIQFAMDELFPGDIVGEARRAEFVPSDFEKDPQISGTPNLFTVDTIVNFVMARLQPST